MDNAMSGLIVPTPVSRDDLNNLQVQIDQANAAYVNGGQRLSIADLLANFPASASTDGKYARVTDLYSSVDDVMRCRYDGTNYRWVPQRESMTGTSAISSGTLNLVPLLTPTMIRLTSTALTGNVNVLPSSVNAYRGMVFDVVMPPVINLGLFTAQITGLVGSNASLLANTSRRIAYDGANFFQVT